MSDMLSTSGSGKCSGRNPGRQALVRRRRRRLGGMRSATISCRARLGVILPLALAAAACSPVGGLLRGADSGAPREKVEGVGAKKRMLFRYEHIRQPGAGGSKL